MQDLANLLDAVIDEERHAYSDADREAGQELYRRLHANARRAQGTRWDNETLQQWAFA